MAWLDGLIRDHRRARSLVRTSARILFPFLSPFPVDEGLHSLLFVPGQTELLRALGDGRDDGVQKTGEVGER
jgi:hypothetical protein